MARPSAYRASKYASKNVGDVVKNRFDSQKDSMDAQATTAFNTAFANEATDKETCITGGATVIEIPFYMAYGRQCAKLVRNHGANAVTDAEADGKGEIWESRGLSTGILTLIAANYGLTVTL